MSLPVTLRVLIVDDNQDFLSAAEALLEADGMSVVGLAAGADRALRLLQELRPDLVLVDVDLGEESGLELARRLTTSLPSPSRPVILISAYPEQDFAELVQTSTAIGFIPKSQLSGQAVRALLRGRMGTGDAEE